jgi:hypothetical protein
MNPNCRSSIQQTMNEDIYRRNLPSSMLQPFISARPTSTKYVTAPIVDPRTQIQPVVQQPTYNISKTFNPGTSAPWSGFAVNVDIETDLRNQFYADQRCDQSIYVPKSNSDLYISTIPVNPESNTLNVRPLFAKPVFKQTRNPYLPNGANVDNLLFNNDTRMQSKGI